MMNIFENAYFGKQYKTRDGRKAIYLADVTNDMSDLHRTYVEGADRGENYLYVHSSGRVLKDAQNALDIVSEWQEPIDQSKLCDLADNYCKENYAGCDVKLHPYIRCSYRDGYRAAKQE